ncbi:nucleotide-diphospho-sugar transferase [Metschnikowia bicuspidata var. bicuspidata NRRL YB-4993]|uniref:Nucleotide-diphospho-sugar transferase n=1 Tax=Metschnikowia bicuspidata var. bicuspidata NRRL YB-4993 TaxID=869754 RepID=A0A1A0HKE4_9ASCO|nr:nucleotide-diphospho-sugar transferase [Metschnikowia bicuspidata var. bicuspidata NRRL YB-4993]OBA24273.1 nucleotide-diphospho-sugar transferase [Metschnikowia bicuspidata var. bicuspidata NRRL YB-4993]
MFAVATLLYDPKYLPGALVLGHTLRKIAPQDIKLVILIEKPRFSEWQLGLLAELWDDLVDTQVSESLLHKKLCQDLRRPELAKTFTKIELWNLPYEKVLYLDADVLPLEGHNVVTDLLKLDFFRGKILAAPDSGFPDIFNSGVFALTPNEQDYSNLVGLVTSDDTDISFDGTDQGLLNQYFNSNPDWVSSLLLSGKKDVKDLSRLDTLNWIRIPFLYNTTPNAQYQYYPALKHFGYPDASPAAEAGQHSSDFGKGESDARPGLLNVSPYENIALEHFMTGASRAQVSVIHFIGASKPWNNESSPLFEKWWLQWYEYSKGKLIDDIMRRQKYAISINRLELPSAGKKDLGMKQVQTPADLCNPSNYQHLRSAVSEANASVWDATKESPPHDAPVHSSFDLRKETFKNDWDEFEQQEKSHREHAMNTSQMAQIFEGQSHSQTKSRAAQAKQSPLQTSHEFGVHEEQIAERVFDERSDYTPHHLLMMTDRNSLVNSVQAPRLASTTTKDPVEDLDEQLARASVAERIPAEQSNGSNQRPEIASNTTFEPAMPKIFPWEYRDMKPERVWE